GSAGLRQMRLAVVKLKVGDTVPAPQALVGVTRQKYVVLPVRSAAGVNVVPVTDWVSTIEPKPASVATSSRYDSVLLPVQVKVGRSATPFTPFAGAVSVGAPGAAANTVMLTPADWSVAPGAVPLIVNG